MNEKPYEAPFKYDPNGGMIWDKNMMWSLDVRGWGSLTGEPFRLSEVVAQETQDKFGEKVVSILNKNWKEQDDE